jgi:hypothetical protein
MCLDRIADGRVPACVEACPNDVMLFGERDEMLARAHERLREHPERYLPRVWGEHEFGGTSVLFVSDVDLAEAGWPSELAAAIPLLTDPLIHETPFVGLGVALGCWGLGAFLQRRNRLMTARARGAAGDRPGGAKETRRHD